MPRDRSPDRGLRVGPWGAPTVSRNSLSRMRWRRLHLPGDASAPLLEARGARRHSRLQVAEQGCRRQPGAPPMTQTNNRFLDDLAKLMTDAAGAAQGMRRDFDTKVRSQGERMLREMDVVQREEFEAVKEMAAKAREQNEQLAARVAALETELAGLKR